MNFDPAAKPPVTSNARRAAALRQRRRDAGLVVVTVWVPQHAAGDINVLSQRLCADPDLSVGPMRRLSTGRLVRLA